MLILIGIVFILGYLAIIFEHQIRLNKAASALITGILCWSVYALMNEGGGSVNAELGHHFINIGGILFFLLGAMVIVELMDAHDSFEIVKQMIRSKSRKKLTWIIGFSSFFLSAVLDNLTSTIVMISIIRKLIPVQRERWMFAGLVIIAANAGGAWSPIGDVTTTMLWTGGQITTLNIIVKTILPSLACFLIPALMMTFQMRGEVTSSDQEEGVRSKKGGSKLVFITGVASLLFVPVFKMITGLPPFMGILFGLGIMWLVTEMIHSEKDESEKGLYSVNHALRKIDTPSILFFLGILLSVSALETTGILGSLAGKLDHSIGNPKSIAVLTGVLSAIVDNVPLVAALQGMYGLERYPTDHYFWELIAYCAGTGGSILIIGSAAGVAAMGMEKIGFFWYLKKIAWLAFIGYIAGAGVFLLQNYLTG